MKIIYMGTPDFAVPALDALQQNDHQILCVVTQPDKARDRGKKLHFPPVKERAVELGIPVLQPEKIKGNEEFLQQIKSMAPEAIIVAAYGKILPLELLQIPQYGCINIHASLLPKYRGAAPIHRCIIDGEKETGVTLMYMEEGLDTGDMIAASKTEVGRKTTAMLHDELAKMGAELLINCLPAIENGTVERTKQDDSQATYAPMVFKKDGQIDFTKTPEEIDYLVRGFNSWPGAYTLYQGQPMKVWEVEPLTEPSTEPFGMVLDVSEKGIKVSAGGAKLLLTKIQMPGKKSMYVKDYLKGNKIELPVVLG